MRLPLSQRRTSPFVWAAVLGCLRLWRRPVLWRAVGPVGKSGWLSVVTEGAAMSEQWSPNRRPVVGKLGSLVLEHRVEIRPRSAPPNWPVWAVLRDRLSVGRAAWLVPVPWCVPCAVLPNLTEWPSGVVFDRL